MDTQIITQLFKNDRGFYARIKMPDAPMRVGKIFFPDRNGVDSNALYEGPLVITETSDRGNYGFFKGHMREMNSPTNDGLIHYLLDKGYWNGFIDKYQTPTGDFFTVIRTMDGPRITHRQFLEEDVNTDSKGNEEDYAAEVPFMDESSIKYCQQLGESILISDFITQYFHSENYEDLYRRFTIGGLNYIISDRQNMRDNPKFISKTFDDAIKEGIIFFYKYGNIPLVEVNMLMIPYMIPRYTTAEINELQREIFKINQAANSAIEGALLHRKMRILRQEFAFPGDMKRVSLV